MDELRQYVLSLNSPNPLQSSIAPQTLKKFVALADKDDIENEILKIVFHFLKCPNGEEFPEVVLEGGLQVPFSDLLDLYSTFGASLSFTALRNWFIFLSAYLEWLVGSERLLRVKYLMAPPLAVVCANIPLAYPEYSPRLCDMLEGWKKRVVYDLNTVNGLIDCYRGENGSVQKVWTMSKAQISCHFLQFRSDFMAATTASPSSSSSMVATDPFGDGIASSSLSGNEAAASLYPSYMLSVTQEWDKERGSVLPPPPDNDSWQSVLLPDIESTIDDINVKYLPLLSKFESNKETNIIQGQYLNLLKKELKARCDLIDQEMKLISALDTRHALLTRQLDVFAHILNHIEGTPAEEEDEEKVS